MKLRRQSGRGIFTLALVAVVLLGGVTRLWGQAYRVIYEFGHDYSDGWGPTGVPTVAKNGDMYGVTSGGGISIYGTIFKLKAPQTRGGPWKKSVLYDFPGGKGGGSPGSLLLGDDGNLYGVDFSQTLFELKAPPVPGGVWKYMPLYTLSPTDGSSIAGITFGPDGNLYGGAALGGDLGCGHGGCGTVFLLKRPAGEGGKWHLTVLYTFTGTDGDEPFAGVTFDQKGNLYGTTNYGGTFGYGTVYRLAPPARKGRPWTETVLHSFDPGNNIGSSPEGPVTFDMSGNLYGTTAFGGDLNCQAGYGCGVAYELSPSAEQGREWTYSTLYAFEGGDDGVLPFGCMVFDSGRNLYGITEEGGTGLGGTVFRLNPASGGATAWNDRVLHGFTGRNGDGALPGIGLTWGKWGDLYGFTFEGGNECKGLGCGTAFEVRP
jgi:uncharacterized repeat protein (TIGR03803 family)